MLEIFVNKIKTLTVPDTVTRLTITHEWGDLIVSNATVVAATSYPFTPRSIGVYKFEWKMGSTLVQTDFYSSVQQYTTESIFFDANTDLEGREDEFATAERRVRHMIEAFTGQKFGPIVNGTLDIQGDGGDSLELPIRITSLSSFTDNWGEDLTDLVEVSPGSEWFLQFKSSFRYFSEIKRDLTKKRHNFFNERLSFAIVGDYGWPYVPTEVAEAASLLIGDDLRGSTDLRQHGINQAQLGDFSYKLNADQWGTTGNTQADLLLTGFVVMRLGLA